MRLVTAKEASEILGVRLPRLYELARLRVVPFVRFGPKQIRFDPEVLAEWTRQGGLDNTNLANQGANEVKDRGAR